MFLSRVTKHEFWASVKNNPKYEPLLTEVKEMWDNEAQAPLTALPYSDFILFSTTGDRKQYETPYFRRRRALNGAALMALLYPEDEQYIRRLEDIIFAICDEYTWCVPAHQPTFEKVCTDHIDLFASEVGFALCEIDFLLGDRLSPLVRERITASLEERIVAPFLDESRDFIWYHIKNNWAAVCLCGVAGVIMYRHPELFWTLKPRFDNSMNCFLSSFGDDGFCTEGIGYWRYGFGFFTVYADMVRQFTKGEIDLFKLPKVKNIATFKQKMFLSEKASVSFADGQRSATGDYALSHYLHREYPREVELTDLTGAKGTDHCGRWCLHIRSFEWFDEESSVFPSSASACHYGKNAQWLVYKTPHFGFAGKAGHNEEAHNHNDVGHFILAADGKQVFADLGAGLYNKPYFRLPFRYETFHCASFGHSVPIFGQGERDLDKICQKVGEQHRATEVEYTDGHFSFDMAKAYGDERILHAYRCFSLSETKMTLKDNFEVEAALPICERFILLEKPEILEKGFETKDFLCHCFGEITSIEMKAEELLEHDGKQMITVYILNILLSEKEREFKLEITYKNDKG